MKFKGWALPFVLNILSKQKFKKWYSERNERMAKFKKWKIRWNSPLTPDVSGYKLYWSVNGDVDYDSDFIEVGSVTEVILPDDVSAFPRIGKELELGLTAVSHTGNESDMTKFSAQFDFTAPDAPTDPVVEPLEAFWWSSD
jgi:hypothetical protein